MKKKATNNSSNRSPEDKAYLWLAFVIILPMIALFLLGEPWRDRGCYLNENVLFNQEINGTVAGKYINKEWGYRDANTLKMKNDIPLKLISEDYYQKIEVGDSLYKAKESFVITIFRVNTTLTLEYKYFCAD